MKDEKNMSDFEYSEHESEYSFDENEDNEIDNLDELFKGMGSITLPNWEAVAQRYSVKKVFSQISQNSEEKTWKHIKLQLS